MLDFKGMKRLFCLQTNIKSKFGNIQNVAMTTISMRRIH